MDVKVADLLPFVGCERPACVSPLNLFHDLAIRRDGDVVVDVEVAVADEDTARLMRAKNVVVEIASPTDHDEGRRVAARILRTRRGRITSVATAEIDLDGPFVVGVSDAGEETR